MRKLGMKMIMLAATLTLAITVPMTVDAKTKTIKKVKTVSVNEAAKRYVKKANSSADKKSGTTKFTVYMKGKVSSSDFKKAVKAIHCKGLKSGTKAAFNDEVLCPVWSDFSRKTVWNSKGTKAIYTRVKVSFDNKKMHDWSSYGKVNQMAQAEKEIYDTLALFEKCFGRKLTKAELGTFAVGWCGVHGGNHNDGNGGSKYDGSYTRSCAKGVTKANLPGSTNCAGSANAAVRVMRVLGFKEKECGVVVNYATKHGWNWWKVDGVVYFGDPSSLDDFFVGADGKSLAYGEALGWRNTVKSQFLLPESTRWQYLGYESKEAYDKYYASVKQRYIDSDCEDKAARAELRRLDTIWVDVDTFVKYCTAKGMQTYKMTDIAKKIKKGERIEEQILVDASDGKKGTKWELSTVHF